MRSAHVDSSFRVMMRINPEITSTRNNILSARNDSLDLLRRSPNFLRKGPGGAGAPKGTRETVQNGTKLYVELFLRRF